MIGYIIAIIFSFLSALCSGVVIKFTPVITVVLIVLDLLSIVNFGVGTILIYGILVYISAWIILGLNALLLAMLTYSTKG